MSTARAARKFLQAYLGTKPDGDIRLSPKGETLLAFEALAKASADSAWPAMPPPVVINTIIDINHNNGCDIPKLKAAGICAVIHKATQGTTFKDPLYHSRQAALRAAGFLTGAYHFNSSENPVKQAKFFIDVTQPDSQELLAFDWEEITHNLGLDEAHTFVQTVFDLLGRYPMIYGSNVCREALNGKPDALLSKCPYWHVIYRPTPDKIPAQVWPTYHLWQYTGTEPVPGSDGADRNKFQGTEAELRAIWPFA